MGRPAATSRPRLGVAKFASCDGCQLMLLNLEDELLPIAERIDIVEFPEATTNRSSGPYDILFVEGGVSAPEHVPQLEQLRREANLLVTIGACATSGGIQALRNWTDHEAYRAAVYAHPEWIESLASSKPIADYVKVDGEVRGCPIGATQLVELVTALLTGRRPYLPDEALCLACKRAGRVCVTVARGVPCLGEVTRTGCGVLCPSYARGCYGCFGPREQANVKSLATAFIKGGRIPADVGQLFAGFTAYSEPFRTAVTELGGTPGAKPTGAWDGLGSDGGVAGHGGGHDARG
ncbi:MAG: NADH-quinone oxidoreductase subunit B family protein [Candidatus Limnocylindria bacterium]